MGHSEPFTAFSSCRIGLQERSHEWHATANTADMHKAAFPQLEYLTGVCHLPCRGNGTLGQILANSPFALSANVTQVNYQSWCLYKGAEKSLARPTSRCILFDGENISFDARLVCINSINNPPIMIINRIYEHKNLLSL